MSVLRRSRRARNELLKKPGHNPQIIVNFPAVLRQNTLRARLQQHAQHRPWECYENVAEQEQNIRGPAEYPN
jgi:hypothetical protein